MVEPGETSMVALAAPGLTLQRISLEVTEVTGELLTGWRTAAVDEVPPAMRVFQMSGMVLIEILPQIKYSLTHTVSRGRLGGNG